MKKTLILAMAMTLALAGSLFAQGTFSPGASIGGFGVTTTAPSTINNDDSCDIGTTPAATLLLPYFEANQTDRNTIFTIVNTTNEAQIAHITIWTDYSFPVVDFNVYLTGYDVQGLSLRDIIFNDIIAPTATPGVHGTTDTGSTTSGVGLSPYGSRSVLPPNPNNLFPSVVGPAGTLNCTNLPGQIPPALGAAMRNALINGIYHSPDFPFCTTTQRVGSDDGVGNHPANTAIGYVTIDVARVCSLRLPTEPAYFATDILFDNVLTGDYETFDASAASNFAGGSPLVHIRAIPEGGAPDVAPAAGTAYTNLPYTFYSRYLVGEVDPLARVRDRRQPLPSMWAARFVDGPGINTAFKIWREGVTPVTTCANAALNSALTISEVVRFDEHENPSIYGVTGGPIISPTPPTPPAVVLPETQRVPVNGGFFPTQPTVAGDIGGWMYLNLDFSRDFAIGTSGQPGFLPAQNPAGVDPTATNASNPTLNSTTNNPLYPAGSYPGGRPAQSWVVVSMSGTGASAGALSVDFDATWLGNGCTANPRNSSVIPPIGPAVAPSPADQSPNWNP
ncbi:MAG TPA: hypothetical protein VM779_05730 [Thermoanaerobaculia bacterium]|nr:hypothetical protein [Thermoanaerobaculia bacterium]